MHSCLGSSDKELIAACCRLEPRSVYTLPAHVMLQKITPPQAHITYSVAATASACMFVVVLILLLMQALVDPCQLRTV